MAKVLIADEVFQNFAKGANCAMQVFAAVAEDIDFSESLSDGISLLF